jgi:hypothetical protein
VFGFAVNCPAAQVSQDRSAVVLGARTSCVPAAHNACVRHALCPASFWKLPSSHAVHTAALLASENVPAAQSVQLRSALTVGAAAWYMPLRQSRTFRQMVCSGCVWKVWFSLQLTHVVLPLAFWTRPAAHGLQYASAVWFTAPAPKRPGSHASQKNAFGVALCCPATHAVHSSAFSLTENLPAGQYSHSPVPFTKVPGLQIPQ